MVLCREDQVERVESYVRREVIGGSGSGSSFSTPRKGGGGSALDGRRQRLAPQLRAAVRRALEKAERRRDRDGIQVRKLKEK